jgi:type VI protein secretion system component VasF
VPTTGRTRVAERDPDTIKQEIDQARDQLASTVDSLAERANPRRLADDAKARALGFVKKPAVAITLAGIAALAAALAVRKIRNR